MDNSLDELRDLATMEIAERQQASLQRMHIQNVLENEENQNRMRDFQSQEIAKDSNQSQMARKLMESIVIDQDFLQTPNSPST